MANKQIKSIKYPGLPDTYTFLQNDPTLTQSGQAADAKVVGDEIEGVKSDAENLLASIETSIGTILPVLDLTQETLVIDISVSTYKYVSSVNGRCVVCPIIGGQTITVTKLLSNRFKLATSPDYPEVGNSFTNYTMFDSSQASLKQLQITAGENDKYLLIYFFLNGDTTNPEADVKASIKAYYGTEVKTPLADELKEYTNEETQKLNVTENTGHLMRLMQAVNLSEANTNVFNNEVVLDVAVNSNGKIAAATSTKSSYIPIKSNAIVTINLPTLKANRFVVSTTDVIPAVGVSVISTATPPSNPKTYTFVTPSNASYLLITYFNSSGSYTEEEIRAEIEVVYGTMSGTEYKDRLHNPNVSSMLMLTDQMLNLLAYRPLGPLKKGYVCMSADDGRYPLATYVLPTLAAFATQYGKPIPLTMGLADVTPAFDVCNNVEYIATVKNSLDNYNCSIGIHGLTMFSGYTREALYNYYAEQHEKLYVMFGHHPSSVLYVSHGVNTQVCAVAGSFYGACGSIATMGTPETLANNARANTYNMKRFSLLSTQFTDQNIKDAVDYAMANGELLCPYWHDINFEEQGSGALWGQDAKDRFEAFVEYCMSKNVDFINFGDIPLLEVN